MRSVVDTLLLNPRRWLLIVGTAGIAAALIGTWSAAVVMLLVVVAASVSAAARGLRS